LESGTDDYARFFGRGRSALARGCDRLEENQRAEVQVIAGDSRNSAETKLPTIDLKLWQALGVAFNRCDRLNQPIEVYEQILAADKTNKISRSDAKHNSGITSKLV